MRFSLLTGVRAMIEEFPLARVDEAFARMESGFGPTKPAVYWSNTSVLESTGVLIIEFDDGRANQIFMGGTNVVRAVRADRL